MGIWLFKNPQVDTKVVEFKSGYGLTPTKAPAKQTVKQTSGEPVVYSWEKYDNDKYQFSLDIPEGWHKQEYNVEPPYGGTIIAFSPNSLPCGTCSYIRDGFFSIRIYDQNSAPGDFALFAQRYKSNDAKDFRKINIAGGVGILTASAISATHENKIFEMSLDNYNKEANISTSQIFSKFVFSLTFTDLQFRQN